jgi:1-phosphofructokinase family hexose kinase
MILCIGTTPAVQRVMFFGKLRLDAVNRAHRTLEGAAGKAINVAKVLQSLGEKPLATGFLGGVRGEQIRQVLEEKGVEADFVDVAAPTRECVTIIDDSDQTITELVQESAEVTAVDYDSLRGIIAKHLPNCRALVMSGTLAPGGKPDFYAECVRFARQCGILSVVDAQGPALLEALAARPGLIKPNRSELGATVGTALADEAAVIEAMRQVQQRGAERVVITAGSQPALALEGNSLWRISPPRITAVNPIGSGDSFTAGLVWRLLRGDHLGEAARWGVAAGAANALTPMPGELEFADVERLVEQASLERLA